MGQNISPLQEYIYQLNISRYLETLPIWRKVLMIFSEKSRVSKEEYDKWFYGLTTHP